MENYYVSGWFLLFFWLNFVVFLLDYNHIGDDMLNHYYTVKAAKNAEILRLTDENAELLRRLQKAEQDSQTMIKYKKSIKKVWNIYQKSIKIQSEN